MSPPETPPSALPLPEPSRPSWALRAVRELRVRGPGRIVMQLHGTGRVNVRRGRFDDFSFEGRGIPKHLSGCQVHLDRVEGTLTLEGTELWLEFSGGRADAELHGDFEVERRGGESAA